MSNIVVVLVCAVALLSVLLVGAIIYISYLCRLLDDRESCLAPVSLVVGDPVRLEGFR